MEIRAWSLTLRTLKWVCLSECDARIRTDREIDESIISVPRPTTPKSRRETQAKGPEQNGNQPTMPERDKGPSAAQDAELQTPRSQTDDANSTIAATSPLGDLSRPQTSRKSIRSKFTLRGA